MDYLRMTEAYLIPPSKKGEDVPNNKIMLTGLEARAKHSDTWEEWLVRRQDLGTYFEVPIVKEKLSIIKPHRFTKFVHNLVWEVDNIWARQFKNFEKLTCLVKRINKKMRKEMDTPMFKAYVEKFYFDENYNNIYNYYISKGKDRMLAPSLEHVNPVSKGGSQTDLDNIIFITFFENHVKEATPNDEWQEVKKDLLANPSKYLKDYKND